MHIHWASDARDQWSHARLHNFPDNKLYGIHKYTVFFYHIVIVYVRNYHNMVKKYCLEALHEKKKLKPCMRSLISCMRFFFRIEQWGSDKCTKWGGRGEGKVRGIVMFWRTKCKHNRCHPKINLHTKFYHNQTMERCLNPGREGRGGELREKKMLT